MKQREIKFRAWNGSKILRQDEIAFTSGISNQALRLSDMLWLFAKDYAIMQFTGLKDKNGVEVFEGDIVKYIDECSDEWMLSKKKIIGDVKYSAPSFIFQQLQKNHKGGHYISHIDNLWVKEVEVIGNIYENTKLIK